MTISKKKLYVIILTFITTFTLLGKSELKNSFIDSNLKYFDLGVGVDMKTTLPYDSITLNSSKADIVGTSQSTSPKTIGLYSNILSLIATEKVHSSKLTSHEAVLLLNDLLDRLVKLDNFNGMFYQYYNIENGKITTADNQYVPADSNAILSFSLLTNLSIITESNIDTKAKLLIQNKINFLLNRQALAWHNLFNQEDGLLFKGYTLSDTDRTKVNSVKDILTENKIERLYSSSRLAVVFATIISQQLKMNLPMTSLLKLSKVQTNYLLSNGKYLPIYMSWTGGTYEELLPTLFINESSLSKQTSVNHTNFINIQNDYIKKHNLPFFLGMGSSSSNVITEFGIPLISESFVYINNPPPLATTSFPYATSLAFNITSNSNMLETSLSKTFNSIHTKYGVLDSIDNKGNTSFKIIGEHQAISILSLISPHLSTYTEKSLKIFNAYNTLKNIYSTLDY